MHWDLQNHSVGWKVKNLFIIPLGTWSHALCLDVWRNTQSPLFLFCHFIFVLCGEKYDIGETAQLCFLKLQRLVCFSSFDIYHLSLSSAFLSQVVTKISFSTFLPSTWFLNQLASSRHCLVLYHSFKDVNTQTRSSSTVLIHIDDNEAKRFLNPEPYCCFTILPYVFLFSSYSELFLWHFPGTSLGLLSILDFYILSHRFMVHGVSDM